MERRNRSSSTGGGSTSASSPPSKVTLIASEDLKACQLLLSHFVHNDTDENKKAAAPGGMQETPFYHAVREASASAYSTLPQEEAASSTAIDDVQETRRMDGLFMMDALANKMKEFDEISASSYLTHNKGTCSMYSAANTSSSGGPNNYSAKKNGQVHNNNSNRTINKDSNHFHQIMTTRDQESGYTPLHYTILQRDLMTLLLLLKHATPTFNNNSYSFHTSSVMAARSTPRRRRTNSGNDDGDYDNNNDHDHQEVQVMMPLSHHPLRLLDGNLLNMTSDSTANNDGNGEEANPYKVINDMTSITDYESLTPLQLLGKTSSIGLEYCRRTLTWRSLMVDWKIQQQLQRQQWQRGNQQQLGISTSLSSPSSVSRSSSHEESSLPSLSSSRRRNRRRMISFGDDRDYNSLQYGIGEDNSNDDSNNDIEGDSRRARGGSFNIINLGGNDDNYSDDDDDRSSSAMDNDLIPLDHNVDFNVLVNSDERRRRPREQVIEHLIHQQRQHDWQQRQAQRGGKSSYTLNDYGCEVVTFGRADHYALGVPQLSSRIRNDDYNNNSTNGNIKDDTVAFFNSKTYKPKRVETFALGKLRRCWSSSSSSSTSSANEKGMRELKKKNAIDSPAVAVAASTHHTLVATRSGQLFSFGFGKGGRLGLGDESHRPLPTRILGPLSKRIVASIAAAENHSLCSTSDGAVFAWGSNGFGQLGIQSSSKGDTVTTTRQQKNRDRTTTITTTTTTGQGDGGGGGGGSRLSPRRVEMGGLKHSFVVSVACGERHSVALTRLGEIYCWGDNKKGQLGVINVSDVQSYGPQRVEGLWSANPRRRAIAISAAAYSTLVLTMPPNVSAGSERASSLASLPVNTVYGWGHGNHLPMRVVFPTGNSSQNESSGNPNTYSRMICINPTAVACAKYHNVAITADGQVYTWGFHSDSLGVPQHHASFPKQKSRSYSVSGPSSSSSIISSPQLVVGMLPENGGGNAVAVSASESHTAIVTSDGHLFTWGEADGKDVLGHKGVRWQPSPRKVKRVHRAVVVAAAKQHTVLLMGTSFPPLPKVNSADGHNPLSLQAAAAIEISRNVDLFNVVPLALVAYRFNCQPLIDFCDEFIRSNLDGVLAVGMKTDFDKFLSSRTIVGTGGYERDDKFHPFLYHMVYTKRWAYSGRALLKQYDSAIVPPAKRPKRDKMKRQRLPTVTQIQNENDRKEGSQNELDAPSQLTINNVILKNEDGVKLRNAKKAPEAQKGKVAFPHAVHAARGKYHCDMCGISCPDSDSFTFHIHGRKHRNRGIHAKAAEEKSVAESMMAMKQMQLVEKSGDDDFGMALVRDTKQSAKIITAWGGQHAAFSGGLLPISPEKGKSFQDILKEEQQKMLENVANMKGTSSPRVGAKSPAPLISVNKSPLSMSPYGTPPTLGSFMGRKAEKKHDPVSSSIGASWGSKPVSEGKSINLSWGTKHSATKTTPLVTQHSSRVKSFAEIQQEEEAIRKKEDHMCRIDGNQWFVQQRERAASISEIQQREQQDKEMLYLIEEQKQIEMDIMMSINKTKNVKKKQQRKTARSTANKSQAKGSAPS